MSFWSAVVCVTLICGVVSIFLARYGVFTRRGANDDYDRRIKQLEPENNRLLQDVSTLKQRIQVLERIATENDRGIVLDREIERLRDAPINLPNS